MLTCGTHTLTSNGGSRVSGLESLTGGLALAVRDLHQQRYEFALPMRVRLGEHGFQLIARSLARNLQFPGGDIGRRAARDDAGELCF